MGGRPTALRLPASLIGGDGINQRPLKLIAPRNRPCWHSRRIRSSDNLNIWPAAAGVRYLFGLKSANLLLLVAGSESGPAFVSGWVKVGSRSVYLGKGIAGT